MGFYLGWCLVFTTVFLFGIVGRAPQARYSFATAQKTNEKRPPRIICPSDA